VAEGEPEIVGDAHVGRVGDGDEQHVAGEVAHRKGLVARRKVLRQQHRGVFVELRLGQVDVVQPRLVGQRPCQVLRRDPLVRHGDLAEPLPGQPLVPRTPA
jgi:hypothetical protein